MTLHGAFCRFGVTNLHPVAQTLHTFRFGAMVAAVKCAVLLQSVAHDLDIAMGTRRRKRMDGTLETVEIVGLAVHDDLEGFIVIIAAMFANGHRDAPLMLCVASSLVSFVRVVKAEILQLLPKPEESEYEHNNDDCANQPDDVVHEAAPFPP
jgi:hypothetical protein